MLNNISELLTPEIYEIMYKAGHLDEIVIVDGNRNASISAAHEVFLPIKNNHLLLEEILKYVPLDDDQDHPVTVLKPDYQDIEEPGAWHDFKEVLSANQETSRVELHQVSRQEFNERIKNAYGMIRTLDVRLYANIIIRKGVVLVLSESMDY